MAAGSFGHVAHMPQRFAATAELRAQTGEGGAPALLPGQSREQQPRGEPDLIILSTRLAGTVLSLFCGVRLSCDQDPADATVPRLISNKSRLRFGDPSAVSV